MCGYNVFHFYVPLSYLAHKAEIVLEEAIEYCTGASFIIAVLRRLSRLIPQTGLPQILTLCCTH